MQQPHACEHIGAVVAVDGTLEIHHRGGAVEGSTIGGNAVIGAVAGEDRPVQTRAAVDGVIARAPLKGVVAITTLEQIIAGQARENIITSQAPDCVVQDGADQGGIIASCAF